MTRSRSVRRRAAALSLVALSAMLPNVASADTDPAGAEALLEQGFTLAKSGDFEAACAMMEASLRLYPSVNTEYYLADCYEHLGRAASAWIDFQEVAEKAHANGEAAKETKARLRAQTIAPQVSHLTISVATDIPGLEIQRDGVHVGRGQWGVALPIDPGTYTVVVSAPGKQKWFDSVEVRPNGALEQLEIPALPDAPTTPPLLEAKTTATTSTGAMVEGKGPVLVPFKKTYVEERASAGETQRIVGVFVGAAGLIGMGVGGLMALSAKSSFDQASCVGFTCDRAGYDGRSSARTGGNLSTFVFALGAAALVGGGVLWLTAPSASDGARAPKLATGVSMGGVVVGGSF